MGFIIQMTFAGGNKFAFGAVKGKFVLCPIAEGGKVKNAGMWDTEKEAQEFLTMIVRANPDFGIGATFEVKQCAHLL